MVVIPFFPCPLNRALLTLLLPCVMAPPAAAVGIPSDFSDKVEAALLCRSEWSPAFWQAYLQQHIGPPLRNWGGADWYKSLNTPLGGVTSSEVFVNSPDSTALIVGALLPQQIESVRKQLEENLKVSFREIRTVDGVRYLSSSGSVLVGLSNGQSKWYCARWQLGNRP